MKYLRKSFSKLNRKASWEVLANVGQSYPARIAIIAPLVGYLVIYNDLVAEFFLFQSGEGNEPKTREQTLLDLLASTKLAFLYFGLAIFGSGSLLFSMFAPRQITQFGSSNKYVEAMERVQTHSLTLNLFDEAISKFTNCSINFDEEADPLVVTADFDESCVEQLDALLEFMGWNAEEVFDDEREFDDPSEDHSDRILNARGNVNRHVVFEIITKRLRVTRAVWGSALQVLTDERSRDVHYFAYTAANCSNPSARLTCTLAFLLGGALLLVPTIITSAQVLSELVGRFV